MYRHGFPLRCHVTCLLPNMLYCVQQHVYIRHIIIIEECENMVVVENMCTDMYKEHACVCVCVCVCSMHE